MLTLYDYFRSSACFRVRIALNLKGLEYNAIPIHLLNNGGEQFSEDYEKINPQHLVPALVDNQKIITQSIAIIEYLDDVHPKTPLLPKEAYLKALVRSFAFSIACDTHPLNNLRVLKYLQSQLKITEEQKTTWCQHWIHQSFQALETRLAINEQTPFCFGNAPTLADICLIPQMYNARRVALDLSAYPNLLRIETNCKELTEFTDAFPKEPVT